MKKKTEKKKKKKRVVQLTEVVPRSGVVMTLVSGEQSWVDSNLRHKNRSR